jgi:hypothetical protein
MELRGDWSRCQPESLDLLPRVAFAFAPSAGRSGWIGRLFGHNGVFRGGASVVYDHFGSDLITQFDQYGSTGLDYGYSYSAASYDFTTGPRLTGSYPTPPLPPQGGFPFTPPDYSGIGGIFYGISPDLRTPYSLSLNASFAREIEDKVTIEVSYVGRLSRKLLLQGDIFTPLEQFRDPVSGVTWTANAQTVRNLYDGGLTPNAVMSKPSLVPNLPFVQSMFGGLANFYFPGSASANYFYSVYGDFGGSFMDALHAADVDTGYYVPGKCLSRTGCYTFFARQGSAMPTWMNAGEANFHGGTVSLRRTFSAGLSFDFNYTLSHSIDNASAAESGAGQLGALVQNIFNLGQFRGSSDFDIRHDVNANAIYELPFGRRRALLGNAPQWIDWIAGGWQISSIVRYHSGLPTVVAGDLAWNTGYANTSLAIVNGSIHPRFGIDENGNPNAFGSTGAAGSFEDQAPGQTGTRAVLRLAPLINFDIGAAKVFRLPWEGQRLQFRAEAFNAFNNVNFKNPSLTLTSPATFGEYKNIAPSRVMQFALRYEF